jgi:DNA-binding NarL/FixJ family response regulator
MFADGSDVYQAQRSPEPIRIFIIDPQPLIAAALHHFFKAQVGFDVVGTAQVASSLMLHAARPDVVLVCQEHGSPDVCMMVATCRTSAPAARVCVVACHAHPELVTRVIQAGASGYTIKDVAPNDLVEAVQSVHHGSTYIDPRVEARPRRSASSVAGASNPESLSAREVEVLKLIAGGYSNREISIALSLSEKTIKNHISRIFAKLHITARTQAVVHAIKSGIA